MKNKITIDIYSDTICPWCYIGLNKLKVAMNDFPLVNFDLIWRPFQLNPKMPIKGMQRQKYLEVKFGGEEKAKKIYKSIYDEGLSNNIHFQFDKILITPNSFASHKLLALAYKVKKQTEVSEALFYNYFIEGINIGDLDELIKIAKQYDFYDEYSLRYLQSDEDKKNLLAEETHARDLGIKGVPCFIINKKFVLYGAQDKKNLLKIFNNIINVG